MRSARIAAFVGVLLGALVVPGVPASAAHGQGVLRAGETLLPGQYLVVSGKAQLIMQTDGNLVLYRLTSTPPFKVACAASHTTVYPGSRAWMSPNGAFSVYTPAPGNRIVWSTQSRTAGWTGPIVQLLDSGQASVNGYFDGIGRRFTFWSC
jgi:hypothetical protein